MENKLTSFIQVYDNALTEKECETLIELFENNKNLHEIYTSDPIFSRLNLHANADKLLAHKDLITLMELRFKYFNNLYRKEYKDWVPYCERYENIRIKKYNNNNTDEFKNHTDANSPDTAHRYLALMVYLNDVEKGGETEFSYLNLKIKPKMGRILIFPPFWMFPHAGLKPISNPKYLLSTYCAFYKDR